MKKIALVFYLMILTVAVKESAVAIEEPVSGVKDFISFIIRNSTFAKSSCRGALIAELSDQDKDILSGAIMIAQHLHPSNPQVTLYHLFLAAMTEVYVDSVPMTYTDINLLDFLRRENLLEDFQSFLLNNIGLSRNHLDSLFEKKSDGVLILNLDVNKPFDHNNTSDFNSYTSDANRLLTRVTGIGRTKDFHFFLYILLFDNPIRRFFFAHLTEQPTLLERTLGRLFNRWSNNSMRTERIESIYREAHFSSSSSIAHTVQGEGEVPSYAQLEMSGDSAQNREDIEVAAGEDYQFLSRSISTVRNRSGSAEMTVDLTDPSLKKWMRIATNIIEEKIDITPGLQNLNTAQRTQIYRVFHDDIVPLVQNPRDGYNRGDLHTLNLMAYDVHNESFDRSMFRDLGYTFDRKSATSIELSAFGAILFSEYGLHTKYMTIIPQMIELFEGEKVYEYAWIGVKREDSSLEFIDTNGRIFWSTSLRFLRERYPRLSSTSDEQLLSSFVNGYTLVNPASPE